MLRGVGIVLPAILLLGRGESSVGGGQWRLMAWRDWMGLLPSSGWQVGQCQWLQALS
jgi:hypothetical protein